MCPVTITALASTTVAGWITAATSGIATAVGGGLTGSIIGGTVVGAGVGAIDGAIVGAVGAAATGGDVGDAALKGAAFGGAGGAIAGGISNAIGQAANAANTSFTPAEIAEAQGHQLYHSVGTTGEAVLDQGAEVSLLMQNASAPATNPMSQAGMAKEASNVAKVAGASGGALGAAEAGKIASTVVQGAGGAVESYGNFQQGKMEAQSLKDQAELEKIRAGQVHEAAAMEKMDLARRQRMTIGKGRTVAAANGIMLDNRVESSPNMWEQDAMAELAYEQSKIDYNANQRAWGHMANAGVLRDNARTARRTGNLKAVTSLVRAGVGMGVSYFGQYYGSPYTAGRTSYYA